jgi:hypothetical protein
MLQQFWKFAMSLKEAAEQVQPINFSFAMCSTSLYLLLIVFAIFPPHAGHGSSQHFYRWKRG